MRDYSARIKPGQPVLYFPNTTTVWVGEAEYIEGKTVIMAWGHGDRRVVREVPRQHVIPLPFALRLGAYKLVDGEPHAVVGLTYAVCPECDHEFEVEICAEDLEGGAA